MLEIRFRLLIGIAEVIIRHKGNCVFSSSDPLSRFLKWPCFETSRHVLGCHPGYAHNSIYVSVDNNKVINTSNNKHTRVTIVP